MPFEMNKRERLLSKHSRSRHAMLFVGVDIGPDKEVKKLRVENSWGSERNGGFLTMTADWFREYVMHTSIDARYLPTQVVDVLAQPAVSLPYWDPLAEITCSDVKDTRDGDTSWETPSPNARDVIVQQEHGAYHGVHQSRAPLENVK